MKIIICLIFLFWSSSAFALSSTVSGCPVNSEVELTLGFSGNNAIKTFVVSTSEQDRTISIGSSPAVFVTKIRAKSNASGVADYRWSESGITSNTKACAPVPVSVDSQSVSLLLGGICGMAFALAIASRI